MKTPFLALALLGIFSTAAMAQLRIIQTNSGGDNISLIDPATNKVVGEIKGIPLNHGAAAAPDGKTLYFSSERTMPIAFPRSLEQAKTDLARLQSWDNGNYNIWTVPLKPWIDAHSGSESLNARAPKY